MDADIVGCGEEVRAQLWTGETNHDCHAEVTCSDNDHHIQTGEDHRFRQSTHTGPREIEEDEREESHNSRWQYAFR